MFYTAGFALLIFLLLYVFNGYGFYALRSVSFMSNYWFIPLLYTASLLREKKARGWWLGMLTGSYFLIVALPEFLGWLVGMVTGLSSWESFSVPVLARLAFGATALIVLSRRAVIEVIDFGDLSIPNRVRLIAVAGFGTAFFWVSASIFSRLLRATYGNSFAGLTALNGGDVPILLSLLFLPLGWSLLRAKPLAHSTAQTVWTAVFAWGVVDAVQLTVNLIRFGLFGFMAVLWHFVLGVCFGVLFLQWLLQPQILTYFGIEQAFRKQKARLLLILFVVFGAFIATAKFASLPFLRDVFFF